MFAPIDWAVIGLYLGFALLVGFVVRERAEQGRHSYFIADRSLPWWWAGVSIAATTFAADTPLAITGIVANRGLSGNWLWLSWLLVHAGVAVVFARRWWRTGVVTDAEFIALRYADPLAPALRSFRALLFGLVYNAIILGWVLRAMSKIVKPLFPWDEWMPGVVAAVGSLMPAGSALGGPSELISLIVLIGLVAGYSYLGGIRGVIVTDLVQFAVGLAGSIWLAVAAWQAVGGHAGLVDGLHRLYGEHPETLAFFPTTGRSWVDALGIGAFTLGLYLLVQSYANVPSDGGGYLQQRLNSTRSERDATKAATLFLGLQYLVRVWPWFVVALAALVIAPIGAEGANLPPDLAQVVAADREMAYPALMFHLLPAGVLGLLVVSLLAAFMSTIDTHFNWGSSYLVTDLYLRFRPDASSRQQIRVARAGVVGFALLAILVGMQIDTIEQAWRWVAFLGASLGVPTALRWIWWRVTAASELAGALAGLATATALILWSDAPYEVRLVWISAMSTVGLLAGIALGPTVDRSAVERFRAKVRPIGFWPGVPIERAAAQLARATGRVAALALGVVAALWLGNQLLFG
ncbi:MAG: sodium:solute symporter family protein [Gemmatimonadales bacterium]